MAELEPQTAPANEALAGLHKMSTTAGVGSSDYVEINTLAIVSAVLALLTAFALFDEMFLLAGVAAIVVGAIALRQVSRSNGTQGGKGLAAVGILLSLGIGATVLAKTTAAGNALRKDKDEINGLIDRLKQAVLSGNYTEAYNRLFDQDFQAGVRFDMFQHVWKSLQDPTAGGAPLLEMKGNDNFEFASGANGERIANTKAIIKFDRTAEMAALQKRADAARDEAERQPLLDRIKSLQQEEPRMRVAARWLPGRGWLLQDLPELMDRKQSPLGQKPR